MAEAQEFATHIVDLLDPFGPCEARRMFGGFGIFHQGLMFGLIADGHLYLKADAQSRELFETEASEAFSYYKQDREYKLSYYQAPEAFFEDPDACLRWARIAFDAALRNPNKSKKKKTCPSGSSSPPSSG
ncbi:MAG: TfoX/Sxy family protein [Gammaproteobacteria bacterium]|nr:TfoX/Sxy family protein [Gammaproteobacteria bacterium]MDH3534972.1 TfoX/Sxy family protein [Gammaproteobacteria bacterium]